jgi:hypothetical protein
MDDRAKNLPDAFAPNPRKLDEGIRLPLRQEKPDFDEFVGPSRREGGKCRSWSPNETHFE